MQPKDKEQEEKVFEYIKDRIGPSSIQKLRETFKDINIDRILLNLLFDRKIYYLTLQKAVACFPRYRFSKIDNYSELERLEELIKIKGGKGLVQYIKGLENQLDKIHRIMLAPSQRNYFL